MPDDGPRRSPLHDVHADGGARFTAFGGWEMPVSFAGITEEHAAVRTQAGVFDVSHMGQVAVTGPDAARLMDRLTSNDVATLTDGDALYALITDDDGVMLDDTLVYRRGPEPFLFVPNAGHDVEMTERWTRYRTEWGLDATVENVTDARAMLAVQGPAAPAILADLGAVDLSDVGRFKCIETAVGGVDCLASRTGYTGEDGFELVCAWDEVRPLWDAVVAACKPCGLGARDTLRTEMGYLLSGQDFHPTDNPRTPFEADVGFAVALDTEFIGRDALARQHDAGGPDERLAGFVLAARGVPRHGYPILSTDGERIGTVTSGTMSPTLGEPIGLGYLPVDMAEPGTDIAVEIRGDAKPATVQATPFIDDP